MDIPFIFFNLYKTLKPITRDETTRMFDNLNLMLVGFLAGSLITVILLCMWIHSNQCTCSSPCPCPCMCSGPDPCPWPKETHCIRILFMCPARYLGCCFCKYKDECKMGVMDEVVVDEVEQGSAEAYLSYLLG